NKIAYSGHTTGEAPTDHISFVYENRPDPLAGYVNGVLVQQTMRLKTIREDLQGTFVREYRLDYSAGARSNDLTLLTSIQECAYGLPNGSDADQACKAKTSFDYETTPRGFNPPVELGTYDNNGYPPAVQLYGYDYVMPPLLLDMNGNGKDDLLMAVVDD